jgi:hypothetical protein
MIDYHAISAQQANPPFCARVHKARFLSRSGPLNGLGCHSSGIFRHVFSLIPSSVVLLSIYRPDLLRFRRSQTVAAISEPAKQTLFCIGFQLPFSVALKKQHLLSTELPEMFGHHRIDRSTLQERFCGFVRLCDVYYG